MSEPRYVVWGSAGHAKVLAALIALRGGRVVALFDNHVVESALPGVPLHVGSVGFERWLEATLQRADIRDNDALRVREVGS